MPIEAVGNELGRTGLKSEAKISKFEETLRRKEKTRVEILEERLLAITFRLSPKHLENRKVASLLTTPFAQKLVKSYAEYPDKSNFDPSEFAARLPRELVDGYTDLVLKEIEGLETADDERLKIELEMILRQLRIAKIKKELGDSEKEIRDLESAKMKKELKVAENKFSELTRKLSKLEDKEFKGIIL